VAVLILIGPFDTIPLAPKLTPYKSANALGALKPFVTFKLNIVAPVALLY
jgi:hypothetical protein